MKPPRSLTRITVTIPSRLASELADLRSTYRVSMSAIAETAIEHLLETHAVGELEMRLRSKGATLRRSRR